LAYVLKNCPKRTEAWQKEIKKRLNDYLKQKSQTSLDATYHYQRAKLLYEKTIQLHTGGREYKRIISEMIYLEDDFNDNAYHFGAALDRYFMVNGVLKEMVDVCDKEILKSDVYSANSYL
jgi:hypothetical protein